MHIKTILPSAALAAALFSATAAASMPPPPCMVKEAGMPVSGLTELGSGDGYTSGVVVENYQVSSVPDADGVYRNQPPPTPELADFFGVRVTACATGDFLAITGIGVDEARYSLRATEFVRPDIKAKRPVSFENLRSAAEALFDTVIVLRETSETCGCSKFYPELRPKALTPFDDRTDVEPGN